MYGTKAADVIAYTYKAATWCPDCMGNAIRVLHGALSPTMMALSTSEAEAILADAAQREGIDRMDESSYDSDDFPKVIFASQVEEREHCDNCGDCILHDLRECQSDSKES